MYSNTDKQRFEQDMTTKAQTYQRSRVKILEISSRGFGPLTKCGIQNET